MDKRYELIQFFIDRYRYESYLEIGIDNPSNCFNRIKAKFKAGVDPLKGSTTVSGGVHFFRMTSDKFFESNRKKFDIIFLDGLHESEQVVRDIENALLWLNGDGVIIVHDVNPDHKDRAEDKRASGPWFGTVWKAWLYYRRTRDDLSMRTWLSDCGCGIIRKGKQTPYSGDYGTYEAFDENRTDILLPITNEELQNI